jgi:cell division septation protein DedD
MTWRDDISEGAQGDLDTVFSQAALLARTLLMRNREFFPFGATISDHGTVGLSTPLPDAASPTVHDVIEAIRTDLRASRESRRAYAIVALAFAADGGEAVRIELEHREGVALVIGLPVVRGAQGDVTFGAMRALPGERLLWPETERGPQSTKSAATKSTATKSTAAKSTATKRSPAKKPSPAVTPHPKPRGTSIATA